MKLTLPLLTLLFTPLLPATPLTDRLDSAQFETVAVSWANLNALDYISSPSSHFAEGYLAIQETYIFDTLQVWEFDPLPVGFYDFEAPPNFIWREAIFAPTPEPPTFILFSIIAGFLFLPKFIRTRAV